MRITSIVIFQNVRDRSMRQLIAGHTKIKNIDEEIKIYCTTQIHKKYTKTSRRAVKVGQQLRINQYAQ